MFRPALATFTRAATRSAVRSPAIIARPIFRTSLQSSAAPALCFQAMRCYSAAAGLSRDEITGRILELLKSFDKVKEPTKLAATSHFSNDLGLDSLDTVEVVMAIEEEFSIEIPDKDADAIHSVSQAVEYIENQPDAH